MTTRESVREFLAGPLEDVQVTLEVVASGRGDWGEATTLTLAAADFLAWAGDLTDQSGEYGRVAELIRSLPSGDGQHVVSVFAAVPSGQSESETILLLGLPVGQVSLG